MPKKQSIRIQKTRPWAPRDAISPKMRRAGEEFIVTSNGSEGCYGGWELHYPAGKAGTWRRFRVKVKWRDLERGYDSVNVAVTWLDKGGRMVSWEPVFPAKVEKGHVVYEGRLRVGEGASVMVAKLLMAWSSRGEIRWREPELRPVPALKPRRMRLGAAGAPLPAGKRTLKTNTEFYLGLCRRAAEKNIDLLCLPEIMLSWGMPINNTNITKLAFTVPGKEIEPFQEFARKQKMVLCFSVIEKNRELVHNTAILIDKKGDLVGKYRKVHLAQPGEVWWGVTPGHDFPVYDLGNAKVGMNICMDSSAAESARVPARQGAEIICLPIMGDHRASTSWYGVPHDFDIERWTMIQNMRAMDNQVYMVVSRNSGYGTGIFSPGGEALGLSGGASVVHADVDLEDLPRDFQKATFRGVCWYERREPTYGPLTGQLLPDPFA